jgi:lysyl-tRNA synthetase, class II
MSAHTLQANLDLFDALDHDHLEEKNEHVSIAGRIMLKRGQGKAGFMHLKIEMDKFKFMFAKI